MKTFANWQFIAMAGCAVVTMAVMSAYYLYFTIYLDEVGIADNLKGYFWAIAVGSETGMMLLVGGLIKKIGLKWTFILSILGCTLRLYAFSHSLGPVGIASAQLLHALTFTTFMVSSITFVGKVTPEALRASGQTLWMALTGGLGSALGARLAGVTVGALGVMTMFRIFAVVALLAMISAIALVREPREVTPR